MRSSDLVDHLKRVLPKFCDDFTNNISITSLVSASGIATATTDVAHGLSVGRAVNVRGALTPIAISSIARSGQIATAITSSDHDLTEMSGATVELSGSTEAEFNGTFDLLSAPNRREFRFQVDDSGPTSSTGSPQILNGSNIFQSYNGLAAVSAIPTTTTFQYSVPDGIPTPALGSITAKMRPRISNAVSIERAIESYTAQSNGSAWMFVVMGDAVANKSRNVDTDAVDIVQSGHYMSQKLVQTIDLFVFLPTSGEISGRQARDRCQELLSPICKSILGLKLPSLVGGSNNPIMLNSHGLHAYSKAYYVHQYAFESMLHLTDDDRYLPDDDVAFRDIDIDMSFDFGTENRESFVDLDDEPLP